MSGFIEEVGVRLQLFNRAAFQDALRDAKADVKGFAAQTVKSNEAVAASTRELSALQEKAAAAIQAQSEAVAKAAASRRAALIAQASGDREAAAAAKAMATADREAALAASQDAHAARAAVSAQRSRIAALQSEARASDLATASVNRHTVAMTGMVKASRTLVKGGLLAATAAAYEGSKAFATYQQALEAIHTQAGLTQKRTDSLGKSILSLTGSGKSPLGPTDVANQMFRIASSTSKVGLTNRQMLGIERQAINYATIAGPGTDPEQVARVFGGVRASGIKGGKNPKRVAALVNAAVGAGDLRASDAINFIGTGVLSSAKLTGVRLPDLLAALSVLGDNLMSGQVTGHSIAHALQLLAAPSTVGINAYKAVGLPGTEIGRVMRTKGKGLPAALADLTRHLKAPGMIDPNRTIGTGMMAESEAQWLRGRGFSRSEISKAAQVGLGAMGKDGKVLIDKLLVAMFGGAKQMGPISTLITQQKRYAAANKQVHGAVGSAYSSKVRAAMKLDMTKLHQFETQITTLGIKIGSVVLPKLVSLGTWFQKNAGVVKGLAYVIGGTLLPATALYTSYLTQRGINAVSQMTGLMGRNATATRGAATQAGQLGTAARNGVPQLGKFASAVGIATTALGGYAMGRAASGHGVTAGITAGLSGALSGALTGFAGFGVGGAVVGGAIGGLSALIGMFHKTSNSVNGTTKALSGMASQLRQSLTTDKGVAGAATKSVLEQFAQKNPSAIGDLVKAGVTLPLLMKYEKVGYKGLTLAQSKAIYSASTGNAPGLPVGVSKIFAGLLVTLDAERKAARSILKFQGQHPGAKHPKHRALGGSVVAGSAYIVGEHRPELFVPQVPGMVLPQVTPATVAGGAMRGGDHAQGHGVAVVTVNNHFHGTLDPKLAYRATKQGVSDALARA